MLQPVWDAYASGLVVDIAIAFTVLELVGLLVWHRLTGRGLAPADYALNMLSGLCLMLALRSALVAFWIGVALCLMAAGAVHITELVLRFRRKPGI